MAKQEYLERQLEFDFMKEKRPLQFGTGELLCLTTYLSFGLSFYSSWMHYIKPVYDNTLTTQLLSFGCLVGAGMAIPFVTKNIIQDFVKNSR